MEHFGFRILSKEISPHRLMKSGNHLKQSERFQISLGFRFLVISNCKAEPIESRIVVTHNVIV